jgi:hypothetical protein
MATMLRAMNKRRPGVTTRPPRKLQSAMRLAVLNIPARVHRTVLRIRARELNVPVDILRRVLLELEARDCLLRPELLRRVAMYRRTGSPQN